MAALPQDIARAQRRAVIVEVEDAAIKAAFAQARDMRAAPAKGYFDSTADAQTAAEGRFAIVGVKRRRFSAAIADMVFPDLSGGVPVWTLIDVENDVNGKALVARVQIDAEEETTTMELFG